MHKIALVEDDPNISESLTIALSANHYKAIRFESAEEFLRHSQQPFSLLLLDINLPGMSGLELCKVFRQHNTVLPIIFLTANKEEDVAVQALSIGGQDFMRKPFGLNELMARIKLLLNGKSLSSTIELSGFRLDKDSRRVYQQEIEIKLSKNEFLLLEHLLENEGKKKSRDQLLNVIAVDRDSSDRTIDTTISRLKQKLKTGKVSAFEIRSSYGEGYFVEIYR